MRRSKICTADRTLHLRFRRSCLFSAFEGVHGITALVVIAALIFGGLLLARNQVKSGTRATESQVSEHDISLSLQISGQTTLAEAAGIGGMPVGELVAKLQLPADINVDEQLGRLKRQYGFEVHDAKRHSSTARVGCFCEMAEIFNSFGCTFRLLTIDL